MNQPTTSYLSLSWLAWACCLTLLNAPAEQLVSELPPQPPPGLPAPVVVHTTLTSTKYRATETSAGKWVLVIGSPMPIDKLLIKTKRALTDVGTTVDVLEELPAEVAVGLPAEQLVSTYFTISGSQDVPSPTFKVNNLAISPDTVELGEEEKVEIVPEIPPPVKAINWGLIGSIIAAVIAISVVVLLVIRRQRAWREARPSGNL